MLLFPSIGESAKVRKIIMLVFLICVREIHALGTELTGKEFEAHLRGEYNRSYNFFGDISTIGAVELNHRMKFKAGFSLGWAEGITEIKIFNNARFNLLKKWPLGLGLSWMYNGLPEYEAHSHTLLPVIYYNAKYGGISIGPGFRFTSYFNESVIFQPTLSISVYANFVNNEKLRIGVSLANFNDFQANNFGLYSLCFNSAVRINSRWSILNELELKQSGGDGLSATFYGVALRGGARFTW
jgi:hypothetical protein